MTRMVLDISALGRDFNVTNLMIEMCQEYDIGGQLPESDTIEDLVFIATTSPCHHV